MRLANCSAIGHCKQIKTYSDVKSELLTLVMNMRSLFETAAGSCSNITQSMNNCFKGNSNSFLFCSVAELILSCFVTLNQIVRLLGHEFIYEELNQAVPHNLGKHFKDVRGFVTERCHQS